MSHPAPIAAAPPTPPASGRTPTRQSPEGTPHNPPESPPFPAAAPPSLRRCQTPPPSADEKCAGRSPQKRMSYSAVSARQPSRQTDAARPRIESHKRRRRRPNLAVLQIIKSASVPAVRSRFRHHIHHRAARPPRLRSIAVRRHPKLRHHLIRKLVRRPMPFPRLREKSVGSHLI